jgi:hypothetical protein
MDSIEAPPSNEVALQERLAQQHPLHGMMGEVFEELGGQEFLLTWAEENQTEFIKMMFKLAPPAIPKGVQGGIHLHVHSDLQPTELDAGKARG